jgi:hypothetical protein
MKDGVDRAGEKVEVLRDMKMKKRNSGRGAHLLPSVMVAGLLENQVRDTRRNHF